MSNTSNTSGKDFLEFWKRAAEKGELKSSTARTIRISCEQILQCTENWETLDMRMLNVEDAFRRFVNKRGRDLKSASLASYKNRLKNGIGMFLDYSNDPSSWKPRMKSRIRGQEKKEPQTIVLADTINDTPQSPPAMQEQSKSLPAAPLIEYPFPLREGQLAYLKLPTNLRLFDVKRLTIYLNSLAIDSDGEGDEPRKKS